ncbi:MBL fold metallo-hydrolase [Psychromonas sp. B3M02]|uniref:MBL fold metallo-hydrolase n=1 Tax=Psychromonas sp. B3M02 TaxID=2267226 RepID=UPI000DEB6A71|nr:MBL fold metallo-hydrolase [Psychromonas sp. B3M02]RBW46866.1 MBL fold metallo-hydrolase [Psychromonas sp. B3M02]
MKVVVIPVTPYQQNCSLLICEETKKAAIVDPGGESERILSAIKNHNVTVDKIILTHGHLDHVGGTEALLAKLDIPVLGPEKEDAFWLQQLETQSTMFGFPHTTSFEPTKWLEEGEELKVGNIKLDILHIPGHTPGHIALFDAKSKQAIVGDILFNGAVGRSDFPRGNHQQLISGIKQKLLTLPQDTLIYPGHGPTTTIGQEQKSNPYLR